MIRILIEYDERDAKTALELYEKISNIVDGKFGHIHVVSKGKLEIQIPDKSMSLVVRR